MRNELTKQTEVLVSYKQIVGPLSSLYQKGNRKLKPLAETITGKLEAGKTISEGARVMAYIERKKTEKARGMREGIALFKKKYKRYGDILEGMIQEKRQENENYLKFGLIGTATLPTSIYVRALKDIGLTSKEAERLYPILENVYENLNGKKKEALDDMLIKL